MKRFSILLILVLISGMMYAQGPFSFGIKVGANIAKMPTSYSGDSIKNIVNESMTGFQAGFYGRFAIKKFLIQPEVYFSLKGGDLTYDLQLSPTDPVQNVKKEIRLYNIDIPLMLGYYIVDKPGIKFRAMGGPVASIVMDQKVDLTVDGVATDFNEDDLESMIWSLQFGLGVDITKITIDARYEFGLNELSSISASEMKSKAILLSLGFKFL
jgi:hypothetical protein